MQIVEEVSWTEGKIVEVNQTEVKVIKVIAGQVALLNGGKRTLVADLNGEAMNK